MKKLMTILAVLAVFGLLFGQTPTATHAQEIACESEVTVQADDWLSKIADKFYGNVLAYPAIMEATNVQGGDFATIANADIIEPGWKLCIPSAEYAQSVLGESMMMEAEPEAPVPAGEQVALAFWNMPFVTQEVSPEWC